MRPLWSFVCCAKTKTQPFGWIYYYIIIVRRNRFLSEWKKKVKWQKKSFELFNLNLSMDLSMSFFKNHIFICIFPLFLFVSFQILLCTIGVCSVFSVHYSHCWTSYELFLLGFICTHIGIMCKMFFSQCSIVHLAALLHFDWKVPDNGRWRIRYIRICVNRQ